MPIRNSGQDSIELRNALDARSLLAGPPWRWLAGRAPVLVSVPRLGAVARLRLQARLNFWRNVCGCSAGGLAFLAALIWSGIRLARAGDWTWTWTSIATVLGVAILAALLAKLAAVAASRAAFAVDILILWRRLEASERGDRRP